MDMQEMLKTQPESDQMDIGQKVMIGLIATVVLVGGYFAFRSNSAEIGGQPIQGAATANTVLAPIVDGEATYTLNSLSWVFEPQTVDETGAPTTRVRLRLDGFKKNGSVVEVGLYRLGTYRGNCESVLLLPEQRTLPEIGALTLAQCLSDGSGRQLAVFQTGNNLIVKVRTIGNEGTEASELVPILTIDLTKIVESAR